jgi:hypothetical protein
MPALHVVVLHIIAVCLVPWFASAQVPGATSTGAVSVAPGATPAPSTTLDTSSKLADLVFTFFAQDATAVSEYERTIAEMLNTTIRRVKFKSTGVDRYGYLFGDDVRVRLTVAAPLITESETRSAQVVRDALVTLASKQDQRLVDIGVVSGEKVDSLDVHNYGVITAWDVVWTLAIVAGGVSFCGFAVFVAFRFHRWLARARREAALEAKEKELAAVKQQAAAHGGAAKDDKGPVPGFLKAYDDSDDGDECGDHAMQTLVADLARNAQKSAAGYAGSHMNVSEAAFPSGRGGQFDAASAAFTAPTDRVPLPEAAQLVSAGMHGRDAIALHAAGAQQYAPLATVHRYLDTMSLPPAAAPSTYLAGVDDPRLAPSPPPPVTQTAGGASSNGTGASPTSRKPQSPSSGQQRRRFDFDEDSML